MDIKKCPVCKSRTTWVEVKSGYRCIQCSAIVPKKYYIDLPLDLSMDELQVELKRQREMTACWRELYKGTKHSRGGHFSLKQMDSLMRGRADGLLDEIDRLQRIINEH